MKIALITDQHFGARSNALWMHDYQKKFYSQLFFPYLKKHNITTVLNGGDLFDNRKNIDILTLNKTRKMFLDPLQQEGISMYIIPGNHDVFFKSINDISSINEILQSYSNIKLIREPTTLEFDDKKITMLPWINNSNYNEYLKFISKDKADILYGHLELAGFEMHSGIKNEHGMDRKVFKRYKQVWSGHFHQPSSQDNVRYLGSPIEITWGDYDCPRGFSVYDTETDSLDFIRNPIRLFEKIFYDESIIDVDTFEYDSYQSKFVQVHVKNKTDLKKYDKFINNLYKIDTIDLVVYDIVINTVTTYNQIQHGQSTRELMNDYVDGINDNNLEKDEIKKILDNLYIEASVV